MIDLEALKKKHAEELHDAEAYEEMAKDCDRFGQIFCDIAHEERIHAKLLEHIIEHM